MDGRNPKDGRWLAEPTWHALGQADVVQVTATEAGWEWRAVVDELERERLGVDQTQARRVTGVRGRAHFEWPGCENDQGGFMKLMWYQIVKEFKCKATSTWSSCDDEREMAFTHRNCTEDGGRTSQLDYILGPRMASDQVYTHNDVKFWCTWDRDVFAMIQEDGSETYFTREKR